MLGNMEVLVRRGTEIAQETEVQFPKWGIVLLVLIAIVFSIATTMVSYTYAHLIPALMMVESSQITLYDPVATTDSNAALLDLDDTKKATEQPLEPELLFVKHKPVTSSFRSTLAHLRARAGRGSSLRGFMAYIISLAAVRYLTQIISYLNFIPLPTILAPVIASVLASHFPLLWTHIVISQPDATRWFRRLAPLPTWKTIAVPTAIASLTRNIATVVPLTLFIKLNAESPQTPSEWNQLPCNAKSTLMLKGFGIAALSFVLWILLVVPAKVTLTRVQASLLPDESEPIIPFDRTFGGKTEPKGVLSMLDAWKTFDWNSRIRLLKAYLKAAAMQFALSLLFVSLAMTTAIVALGSENLKKLLDAIKTGDENFKIEQS